MILFGTVAGTFAATKCLVVDWRNSDDFISSAIAGVPAGMVMGSFCKKAAFFFVSFPIL
jgi:hypothetical protein